MQLIIMTIQLLVSQTRYLNPHYCSCWCFFSCLCEFSMNEITTAGGEIRLIDLSNLLHLFFTSCTCLHSNHHFSP
ncbi:hypothetical protein HanRHA438_Chr13g0626421 [Helianthus annuus]|nr:hypothetical protein HanRHA438_Chr13g0626421 [Helianthus annuus]